MNQRTSQCLDLIWTVTTIWIGLLAVQVNLTTRLAALHQAIKVALNISQVYQWHFAL